MDLNCWVIKSCDEHVCGLLSFNICEETVRHIFWLFYSSNPHYVCVRHSLANDTGPKPLYKQCQMLQYIIDSSVGLTTAFRDCICHIFGFWT